MTTTTAPHVRIVCYRTVRKGRIWLQEPLDGGSRVRFAGEAAASALGRLAQLCEGQGLAVERAAVVAAEVGL